MDNVSEIIKAGIEFYETEDKQGITRYKSWNHCHKAFKEAKEKKKLEERDIDYLCLQLSTYLASWGMFRNSFLLWCDYKVHEDVIKNVILNKKYSELWDIKIDNYNEHISKLSKLIKEIRDHYEPIREEVYNFLEKTIKKDNGLTDTLISKILLGTMACVPAYDRYFISAVRKTKITTGVFNSDSIKKLVNNEVIKDILTEIPKKYSDEYPQMKLLDSCLWQYGYNLEKDEEANKK